MTERTGPLGQLRRQWPWVLVVALIVAGLVLVALDHWRRGAGMIGGAMVVAAFLRAILPAPGILAVRDRAWIDVAVYGFLGVAIIVFGLIVPSPFG